MRKISFLPTLTIAALVGLILSGVLVYADWTPPLTGPPACNPATDPACSLPLDVSNITQSKKKGGGEG